MFGFLVAFLYSFFTFFLERSECGNCLTLKCGKINFLTVIAIRTQYLGKRGRPVRFRARRIRHAVASGRKNSNNHRRSSACRVATPDNE